MRTPITSLGITFLGTASAQPSSTRNHSSLALRLNGDVWLFDCGEATQHQIMKSSLVKMGKIEKMFITHLHSDHIGGLLCLLASAMNGDGGTIPGVEDPRVGSTPTKPPLEIYGPLGTRAYVRNGLKLTYTLLEGSYVVHELRFPEDPTDETENSPSPSQNLHLSESPDGRNIALVDGKWADIFKDNIISVSAAPILHSVPCVGYVVHEAPVQGKVDPKLYIPHFKRTGTSMKLMGEIQKGQTVTLADGTVLEGPPREPGRKIVILGDTYDPSPIEELAKGADIVVHEATNAHLPGVDGRIKAEDTYESVEERAKSRGHSTPQMAGKFAKRIGASNLFLNHFSSRYSDEVDEKSRAIMFAIKHLAVVGFGRSEVVCGRDLMNIEIPPKRAMVEGNKPKVVQDAVTYS
ncbi:Metallo-hydrolase oxidoreductase [Thelephora terrestris]|uniref:Metallo-hydrolase oxidoreductase n=1 Tax=Thelephora terrestris TaxID=56493 RepID=A0A9P6H9T4_9AGAM|nr:Metallo-hydrolase oxidoreductase [Thelephora terrestris]